MDFISTYGLQILDVAFIIFFFIVIFSNLPLHRMMGVFKGIIFIIILWFFARLFSFSMAETILSNIIQYGFLGLLILFPNEFKKLLENLGRRRFFNWNINSLIALDSRRKLAKALVHLADKKQGAIVVIAKGDNLDEEIDSGTFVGEMAIESEFIEMIFHSESDVKDGALIIKDNEIVSTKCRLPVLKNEHLEKAGAGSRHFAGLGVTSAYDCIAFVVSETVGTISIMGYLNGKLSTEYALELKQYNVKEGITEDDLVTLMETYLKDNTRKKKPKKKPVKKQPQKQKQKPVKKSKKAK